MTERETLLLRQYCAKVLNEYGFEFSTNDPVLPALYTIHRELNANKAGNELVAKSIKDALAKLNPTIYNFNERGEAWKFKLADSLRWLFVGLSVVAAIFVGLIWWRQYNDVYRAREMVAASSAAQLLLNKNAGTTKNGFLYLEFSKAKGKYIENFTEYMEVKQDTIRVFLGKVH
jgi:hypothetical protein